MRCGNKLEILLIIFSCIILLNTSCSSSKHASDVKQAEYHYQLGVSRFNEKNYPQAIEEIENVLEINPAHVQAHNMLGLIYLDLKYYDKAIIEFTTVITLNKDFIDGQINLGVTYMRMLQNDKAIEMFKSLIDNPLYASSQKALNAYLNIGNIYYNQGKYDDAIKILKKSLLTTNNFYPAYYLISLCFNKTGKFGYAIEAFTTAIEYDPEFSGDIEKAKKEFSKKAFLLEGREKQDIEDFLEIMNY
ncbi:MAG: tetratricopeptide repeat protein [Nitrospirae bacterium]|nr:tetratricopeptide repeat protein [Nitrospirota bacterium]MBF0540042.1 tetratricopeptide repeat protein [Nitrospirota bacterium]